MMRWPTTARLYKTISKYIDEEMLAAIAAAYDARRLLLIASADLDAQQPVIRNIGAIAKSGHPKAASTIRRICCFFGYSRCLPADDVRGNARWKGLPGDACRWWRLCPDLPLSIGADG